MTCKHLSRFLKTVTLSALFFGSPLKANEVKSEVKNAKDEVKIASENSQSSALKVGIVNFKNCLEKSKIGKAEQSRFEEMKNEVDKSLQEREKALSDLSARFNDEYIDSISPEAETELKEQFRKLSQEFTFAQNQYYQLLNQTNMRMLQSIGELIQQASNEIAQKELLDMVLSEDSCFYYADKFDVTPAVVEAMDALYEKQKKEFEETAKKGALKVAEENANKDSSNKDNSNEDSKNKDEQ